MALDEACDTAARKPWMQAAWIDANPSLPPDWPGGFLCPRHVSTFDGAGRVFGNKPAPTSFQVPAYRGFGSRVVIGDDGTA